MVMKWLQHFNGSVSHFTFIKIQKNCALFNPEKNSFSNLLFPIKASKINWKKLENN